MSRKKKKVLEKVLGGLYDANIKFGQLRELIKDLGFDERIKGDHYIFTMTGVLEIINLQPLNDGRAKAYQVKQVRKVILKYRLHEEREDV